jgi:fructose-1,6-bisphosphatase I
MKAAAGYPIITLNEFIINSQEEHPEAKGDLSRLLHHIGIAAKIVNKKINKAGLVDILGVAGRSMSRARR